MAKDVHNIMQCLKVYFMDLRLLPFDSWCVQNTIVNCAIYPFLVAPEGLFFLQYSCIRVGLVPSRHFYLEHITRVNNVVNSVSMNNVVNNVSMFRRRLYLWEG